MSEYKSAAPLKGLIREMLDAYHLKDKVNKVKISDLWAETVGNVIAGHTLGMHLSKRTLYVELDSSVVRNELRFLKSKIIEELNRAFGERIIDQIIFK